MKYSKEVLEQLVKESSSLSEVMRKLNVRQAGGTHSHLARRLNVFDIYTDHFSRKPACVANGGNNKLPWQSLLVERTGGRRREAHQLRRALVESGSEYKRTSCGNQGSWQGDTLTLEINHRNRNWLDDRAENLEFLCPNCHSQHTRNTSKA